ncbi:PaaI family thioesterase [Erythrobacter sp. NE805]|uniref:PaaI family thioesterase n=1 Tax=Erythrobacter sp. NE805 TaxID=3389875 RepID=UPI00396B22C1
MTDLLALGRGILAAQPFSQLLGTEMTEYSERAVELRLAISDKVRQQHGFVHGGVLAYLADNALTFAGGAAMGGGVLTSDIKLNYIRPAVGELLIARAAALAAGRTQGVVRCEVFAVNEGVEKLCVAAQGTVAKAGSIPVEIRTQSDAGAAA